MSTKATVLHESHHQEFLQTRRRDPVTHKLFTAGDRVTRCASCLLPFLEQSWQAAGRTHCGQFASVGLDNVEPPPSEGSPTKKGDPKATGSAPEDAKTESRRLELAPIPIALQEVSIKLK
jgi:hypothetical protein